MLMTLGNSTMFEETSDPKLACFGLPLGWPVRADFGFELERIERETDDK